MRKQDIDAMGELAGEVLWAGGALVKGMHEGIARRPFAALGPAGAPWRVLHDATAQAAYGGVRRMLTGGARGLAALAAAASPSDDTPLPSRPVPSVVLGALNGLYGDHLARRGNELALSIGIWREGEVIETTADHLADAFPDATSRAVVFVHGLCETEASWRIRSGRAGETDRRPYGQRLRDDLGFTPVYLRYNSGLHVSENGRALAGLLDELVRGWPVAIDELTLVGHSMGGLVARSACHYGGQEGRPFARAVRHVFCLGSPHLGADLEKGANVLGWAMARLPETRPFAGVLNARSAGIKDLRFGSCVDEDWSDCDPDEFLRDRCREVPFLPEASYYFIATTVRPGPLGSLLGDLLVRLPSASGRGNGSGRRIPFAVENGCELDGLTHFDLLNHPAVYEQLRHWLAPTGAAAPVPC